MNTIDYATQRRERQRSSKKPPLFFLVSLVLLLFLFWVSYKGISSLLTREQNIQTTVLPDNQESLLMSNPLARAALSPLVGVPGSYGIYIKHLKTGEILAKNEHKQYESASLYKLWVMATAFEQIKTRKLNESQELKEEVAVLNEKFRIATESAELTEGTIDLTVHDALEKMITISDNYAALLLAAKIRLSTIASFLDRHGFEESKVGINGESPTTTAFDMALFFEKLYKGELADEAYTAKMIDLLKRQTLNEKLPKHLPEESVIAHKTGELGTFSHDAGIVYTTKGDYIIVVLSDTRAPAEAVKNIAEISEGIYRYFTK